MEDCAADDLLWVLRNKARESGVYLKVVKNTLSKRAFEETDFKCLLGDLNGPIIIALSKEDLASPARLFNDFSKDNEQLKTVGLAINGEAFPVSDIDRISKLPTKDEAYSMLLGLMKAPIEKAVSLMNEIPTPKCLPHTIGECVCMYACMYVCLSLIHI